MPCIGLSLAMAIFGTAVILSQIIENRLEIAHNQKKARYGNIKMAGKRSVPRTEDEEPEFERVQGDP